MKVTIIDETTAGQRFESLILDMLHAQVTARAILEERIREEVKKSAVANYSGRLLVQRQHGGMNSKVDVEDQIRVAVQAFESGRLIMIVADRQVEDLDAPVALQDGDEVSFLRLIPLIGG